METRKHLLEKASLSESEVPQITSNIISGDALALKSPPLQLDLEYHANNDTKVSQFAKHSFHCIVGNPPYIRIQNTSAEKRDYYTSAYLTASGRFDISTLFIELAEHLLKDQGRLGFIVSNKILSTSSAKRLRSFLISNFAIEEIVDLSDTKLFDAAVLPMIHITTHTQKNNNNIAYSSITESNNHIENAIHTDDILGLITESHIPFEANIEITQRIFQVQRFYTNTPSARANVWTFHNERENRLLSMLRRNSACTLGEISEKISVGLKTTADQIFIKPMTQNFIKQKGFEPDVIFPLFESHNIGRWRYSWNARRDLYVLYPHAEQGGKVVPINLEAYPRVKKYLEANKTLLEARTYLAKSDRRWYEIWVHQSPSDFRLFFPKNKFRIFVLG